MLTLAEIGDALARQGLLLRGGFQPAEEDGVPAMPGGTPARAVVIAGNAGPAMWRHFAAAPEAGDGDADPLDRWTRRVLEGIAGGFGARALFPFDGPPYLPIQRWAARAEPVFRSPLGLFIHPTYGLWHAYRGALALAEPVALPPRDEAASPCESCRDRPCLSACPVGAFSAAGYDVPACAGHLELPAGADCMSLGCRARRACPVGAAYRYDPAQAEFHMLPFRRNALARLRRAVDGD